MKDKHDIKYIDINQLYDVSKLPYIDDSKYDFKIVTCIWPTKFFCWCSQNLFGAGKYTNSASTSNYIIFCENALCKV